MCVWNTAAEVIVVVAVEILVAAMVDSEVVKIV
jgi:hypothetical protein